MIGTATPRVIYSISTGLGGVGLAQEAYQQVLGIWRQGWLKRAVVYGNRQGEIPRGHIRNIRFHPGKLISFVPARFYYGMKKDYVDWLTGRLVARGCDLFHGWSNESYRSLLAAHRTGAVGFVEAPGIHAGSRVGQALWRKESEKYGIVSIKDDTRYAFGVLARFITRRRLVVEEYALADRIITPSQFVWETFRAEGTPAEKLVVIPRGVDVERFRPAAEPPSLFRALFVGAVRYRKGVQYLLEAWERLQLPEAELVVVGDVQAEIASLVAQHEGRSDIRFVRHTDPLPLYQSASVFVFPSLAEGSAKVTYEAMACGLPVIVTPNAGSVARDGVDGYLVPARDPEALADRILDLYRRPERRREMGRAARQQAEAHTWDHHRARLLTAYAEALGLSPDDPRWPEPVRRVVEATAR